MKIKQKKPWLKEKKEKEKTPYQEKEKAQAREGTKKKWSGT